MNSLKQAHSDFLPLLLQIAQKIDMQVQELEMLGRVDEFDQG